ncbi:short-chain dehydrogenase [Limnohabitans curvus]|uniref:Short-chain dehydrogenase n=1 Tax=Limnohabitans curvus TaxID=323423 RepID=A0A315ES86_9BURK|nr:SDR family NAD(P)-dependent oxidoreductase [Limnohabitans curvus]PUE59655.1 short-chain dehydrogenase [Limnohabitans curvus]
MQHIVIIGATSAMAEHCARLWVQAAPVRLTLVGRDEARTRRVADDLRVRSPQSDVHVMTSDFVDAAAIQRTVSHIVNQAAVDVVLIAHGVLSGQGTCQDDLLACDAALQVNGVSPVLFAEAFAKPMVATNHGTIAIIGSVAGDRGRKTNYVYGAAKGLVSRYAQGMQHRLAQTNVKVVLIKPGPTDTPMTSDLKAKGQKMASVEVVAQDIVKGIASGKPVVYTPGIWQVIMLVVMHLPRFVFNKLNI